MIGSGDVDGVEIRLFVEKLAIVAVGVAAFVGGVSAGLVKGLDHPLEWLAASEAEAGRELAGNLDAPGRGEVFGPLFVAGAEQGAGSREERVVAVFEIILGTAVDVADADDL